MPPTPSRARKYRGLASIVSAALLATVVPAALLATPASAVADSASLTARETTVEVDDVVKLVGVVPGDRVRRVELQVRASDSWRDLRTDRSGRRGDVVFTVAAGRTPGVRRYRLVAPATGRGRTRLPAVTTPTVAITVVDPRGSRTNPVDVGETFSRGGWELALDATDTDAWPEMRAYQDWNEPPLPGWSYVVVSSTLTFVGRDRGRPLFDISDDFLAADHRIYDRSEDGTEQWCSSFENDVMDIEDMYTGATVVGSWCAIVPTAHVTGGLWRLTITDDRYRDHEVFVRLG